MKTSLFILLFALSNAALSRTVMLDGKAYTETRVKHFDTWVCGVKGKTPVANGRIFLEAGVFVFDADVKMVYPGIETKDPSKIPGFVVFDGTSAGEIAVHYRQGLSLRWDWGLDRRGRASYGLSISPTGKGYYVGDYFKIDRKGNKSKPVSSFRCDRRVAEQKTAKATTPAPSAKKKVTAITIDGKTFEKRGGKWTRTDK